MALVALAALFAIAGCASMPKNEAAGEFDFGRYPPTALAEADKPGDGICKPTSGRPAFMLDMALTPMRLRARASQSFRPLPTDTALVIEHFGSAAEYADLSDLAEEVRVTIEGQERWLPIQTEVARFWRDELATGQDVWLYVTRIGCTMPVDPAADRAILSINEFQIEPIGQPEPYP